MPECAKAHLQQCRISKFGGRTPGIPAFRVGAKEGKGEGWVGGRGRKGKMQGRKGRLRREAFPQTKNYHYTTGCIVQYGENHILLTYLLTYLLTVSLCTLGLAYNFVITKDKRRCGLGY